VHSAHRFSIDNIQEDMHISILDVRKLKTTILKVVPLTKNKTKMFDDEMPFDAPVSSKTFLNLKKTWQRRTFSDSIQIWTCNARQIESMFLLYLKGKMFVFQARGSCSIPSTHTHTHTHTHKHSVILITSDEVSFNNKGD
jgi:hypothetical protein